MVLALRSKDEILASIRECFAAFGFDLSSFSDDEIEVAIEDMGFVVARFGVECHEAAHALEMLKDVFSTPA